MAYDEKLAGRVRAAVVHLPDLTEKKMFGGLAFLLDGRMFCGIIGDQLVVRVGPDRYEQALAEPHVRPMDFTGRPMRGYVYVGPAGARNRKAVEKWVTLAANFVSSSRSARRPRKLARRTRKQARTRKSGRILEAPTESLPGDRGDPDKNRQLALALICLGRFAEAEERLRVACDSTPRDPRTHTLLGVVLFRQRKIDEAEAELRKAVALQPDAVDARISLGNLLFLDQRVTEAETVLRGALESSPDRTDVVIDLARLLLETGRAHEALESIRAAQRRAPGDLPLQSALCAILNYLPDASAEELFREHARCNALVPPADANFSNVNTDPRRRLRIGYLSPNFSDHAVTYFFEPLLEQHDRAEFEIVCYHLGLPDHTVTPRLQRKADRWRSLVSSTNDAVLEAIRRDQVDILVDLAGHTRGCRLIVLARRAAPVQCTYIGYLNTVGIGAIDYRIVGERTDPPGAERLAVEQLVRLPKSFLCYRPRADSPDPADRTGRDPIVFGSLNNIAKLSAPTVEMWSELLHRVPTARLALMWTGLADRDHSARVAARFAAHGVAPERLRLSPRRDPPRHLEEYRQIDVALDPVPYNGVTTTCEALWMGVPVVTLEGDRHAGRVGGSLLSAVGLDDLVAGSRRDYVAIAAALADDPERLHALRSGLRGRMRQSRLCDSASLCRDLEAEYRRMWRTWCTRRNVPS